MLIRLQASCSTILRDDKIFRLIIRLRHEQEEGLQILVEGKRDKQLLDRLGLRARMLDKPVYAIVESLLQQGVRSVLILTDRDPRGERLHGMIKHACLAHGMRVRDDLRDAFFSILRVTHVEDVTLTEEVWDQLRMHDWLRESEAYSDSEG